jgi:hypothetical protein
VSTSAGQLPVPGLIWQTLAGFATKLHE